MYATQAAKDRAVKRFERYILFTLAERKRHGVKEVDLDTLQVSALLLDSATRGEDADAAYHAKLFEFMNRGQLRAEAIRGVGPASRLGDFMLYLN